MLRRISILLILLICLPTVALASHDPNLLWDIPYNTRLHNVIELLEARGITTKIIKMRVPLLGVKSALDSTNDGDFNLYGYSYHLCCVDASPIEFNLTFSIPGSCEDKASALARILSGLADKYGFPDYANIETYSNGFSSWTKQDRDGQHEIAIIDPAESLALSPYDYASSWPYSTPETDIHVRINFYNISVDADITPPYSDSNLDIKIRFSKFECTKPKARLEEFTCPPAHTPAPLDSF